MAERDMNQQSVTLAKMRRNHQKYKTQSEMEQRSAGGMTSQFLTAAFRGPSESMTSRLIWREISE